MILIGSTIVFDENGDSFKVIEHAGSGGFGDVYKIEGTESGDIYALKTMNISGFDTRQYESLVNEAKLAMNISSENVLKYYYFHDGLTHSGLPPYIIMDYANEGSLRELIDKKSEEKSFFTDSELKNLTLQVLRGAKAVNDKVLHRDFHPGNILIDSGNLKVTDFGLSKVVDTATRTNTFKGITHLWYKAPESWKGESNKIQLDMYAVGITLFELACLEYPYDYSPAIKEHELMNMHLLTRPKNPKFINRDLSGSIQEIILRLMSKNARDRFDNWDQAIGLINEEENSKDDELDLSDILEVARDKENERERNRVESEKRAQVIRERKEIFRSSILDLQEKLDNLCSKINKATSTVELRIDKNRVGEGFTVQNDDEFHKRLEFMFYEPHIDSGQPSNHSYKGKELMGWGFAKVNREASGFNVLMLRENPEDIHPTLYLMKNRVEAGMRNPAHYSNRMNPSNFCIDGTTEFNRQFYFSSQNVMSGIHSDVRKLDINEVKEYVKDVF